MSLEKSHTPNDSEVRKLIMEFINKMERDLEREIAIQNQMENSFQVLESKNAKFQVCKN